MTQRISVGVKVFLRTKALRRLLRSARGHDCIQRVVVADDGRTADRRQLYERDWPFELDVLDLDYDAGIGPGRCAIVDATEGLLLMLDPDMQVPANLSAMVRVLDADDSIGGVAPMHAGESLKAYASDYREFLGGDVLVRGVWDYPEFEHVGGELFCAFDQPMNQSLYRRGALEDYCWDRSLRYAKDHLDMFLGHWHGTDWRFGVAPEVVAPHHDLIEDPKEYQETREDRAGHQTAREYLLDKWDYRQILTERIWVGGETVPTRLPDRLLGWAPMQVRVLAHDIYDRVDIAAAGGLIGRSGGGADA